MIQSVAATFRWPAISMPAAVLLGLVAIQAIWTLAFPTPLAWDYLNHAARLEVINSALDDPLRRDYQVVWGLIPNLGLDLAGIALSPWLSAETATRLVWFVGFVGAPLATWLLQRQLYGHSQPSLPLASVLMFNLAITAGLINYALSMVVGLLALTLWLRWRDRPWWLRLLAFNLLSVCLYVFHIGALAGVVGLIGLIELLDRRSWASFWRAARVLAYFAAGLGLSAASAPVDPFFVLDSSKFFALIGPVFAGWIWLAAIEVVVFLTCLYFLARGGFLRFHPLLGPPLLIFCCVLAVAPTSLGATSLLDSRLAIFAGFVAVAAMEIDRKKLALIAGAALVSVCVKLIALTPAWQTHQLNRQGLSQLGADLPAGARLVVAEADPKAGAPGCAAKTLGGLDHVPAILVAERRVFVHVLFSGAGMQPLQIKPALRLPWLHMDLEELAAPERHRHEPWAPALLNWRQNYQYVVLINPDCAGRSPLGLTEIGRTKAFGLYAVKPDLSPAGQTR